MNGAPKLLFTAQPAISRIVSHTEQTLGLELFNRVKGKLVPMPESEALFQEVEDFYQHALRVDEFSRNLATGPSGVLRVSASPYLSKGLVSRAVTQFLQRCPKIRVHFHSPLLADMAREVLSNKVDQPSRSCRWNIPILPHSSSTKSTWCAWCLRATSCAGQAASTFIKPM
ncbi:LysR family transcriptional regulator [Candidimonas nitroreducens]|uniref:LysR family transcriptional regulator n=1 Tax=Candidimonas nitroreducens TaxID=683354 RepID=UPI001E4DEF2B|nr:LysR substrate-binding domain-containing protein [Candidimonas nitroreducens]